MDIDHLVAFLQATDFLIIAGGVGMFLGMISAAQSELNALRCRTVPTKRNSKIPRLEIERSHSVFAGRRR
jgi:hypothetical protein